MSRKTIMQEQKYYFKDEQLLLLQAALLQGDEALTAWRAWRMTTDLDQLGDGAFALLPLLYYNLNQQGVTDPVLDKCKGIYRKTWVQNQLTLKQLAPLAQAFQTAGLPLVFGRDVAVALLHYPDRGLRMLNECALLVAPQQIQPAVALLTKHGYEPIRQPATSFNEHYLAVHAELRFRGQAGQSITLQWPQFTQNSSLGSTAIDWEATSPVSVNDVVAQALNPTDQLIDVCQRGFDNPASMLQWVADALMILRTSAPTIDWARLVVYAQNRALTVRFTKALAYLQQAFSASIPAEVQHRLMQHPSQAFEASEQAWLCRPYSGRRRLFLLWADYQRQRWLAQQPNSSGVPMNLTSYLQHRLALPSPWWTPYAIGRAALRQGWQGLNVKR